MNIKAHYESYRKAVMEDALEGFPVVAGIELTSNGKTYTQELSETYQALQNVQDIPTYRKLLCRHQELVFQLFKKMVSKLSPREALDRGLNWHQFGSAIIHFDGFYWVPREELIEFEDMPVFTTFEMKQILNVKPITCEHILKAKTDNPALTITKVNADGSFEASEKPNKEIVVDWTQGLFYEE